MALPVLIVSRGISYYTQLAICGIMSIFAYIKDVYKRQLETCLVHEAVAEQFLPMLQQKLEEHQVEIRGCERTRQILGDSVIPATEEDYATEFLDYIISCLLYTSLFSGQKV